MNIKINKEEFEYLMARKTVSYLFGSRLYGTNTEKSDWDYMVIYDDFGLDQITDIIPSHHQFQYDDLENNTQYVFTTERQFRQNLLSGDSTINSDIIIFDSINLDETKFSFIYSFKVIKAYLGFAKRDISNIKGKNKLFHVRRGLYIAKDLMNGNITTIEEIQNLHNIFPSEDPNFYLDLEKTLRFELHELHAKGAILDYNPKCLIPLKKFDGIEMSLRGKLIKGINTREFKY